MPIYKTLALRGHLKTTLVSIFTSRATLSSGGPTPSPQGWWGLEHSNACADKYSKALAPLLSVYQKHLLRGRQVAIDPEVAAYISAHPGLADEVKAVGMVSLASDAYEFDSASERAFLEGIAGGGALDQFVCPQFPLDGLVDGPATTGERVDFFIAQGDGSPEVVEIDGPEYHAGIVRKKDASRTSRLKTAGITEIRFVPGTAEFTKGMEHLRKRLANAKPRPQVPQQIAHALNCALFLALRHGALSFNSAGWLIQIECAPVSKALADFMAEALKGALRHVGALAALYGMNKGMPPAISLSINGCEARVVAGSRGAGSQAITLHFSRYKASMAAPGHYCYRELPGMAGRDVALRPIPASTTTLTADKVACSYLLRLLLGHEAFNDGQLEALGRVLGGGDAIVLLPTGGGKSAIYQLAGMLLPGTTLVVAPAMALITDQVRGLCLDSGIERAAGFTSEMGQEERLRCLDSLTRGQLAFALVTPQRLLIPEFQDALAKLKATSSIPLVVMDEAHCVSEWGHDFVTEYLGVGERARALCGSEAVVPTLLALTGTATESVLRDVRRELGIATAESVITPSSFDRPEIQYGAMLIPKQERAGRLAAIVAQVIRKAGDKAGQSGASGVIFCPHVNGDLGILNIKSIIGTKVPEDKIALFSGGAPKGMEKDDFKAMKAADFSAFMDGKKTLMIATKAFGMGINHKLIRFTVHIAAPGSIESLYQESGRAGRNKKAGALALFLTDTSDASIHEYFLGNSFPGIPEEMAVLAGVLKECGNLVRPFEGSIEARADEAEKKVAHRLKLLGLIADYRIRYATSPPLIEFQRNAYDPARAAEELLKYVASFEKGLAEGIKRRLPETGLPAEAHLTALYRLLCEFIYERIKGGREQALSEVLALLKQGAELKGAAADKAIRARILHYLESGSGAEFFARLRDAATEREAFDALLGLLDSGALAGSRLRGRTARLLESHPDNPAYRMLRAIAELECSDGDPQVALRLLDRCVAETPEKYGISNAELIHQYGSFVEVLARRQPEYLREALRRLWQPDLVEVLLPFCLKSTSPVLRAEVLNASCAAVTGRLEAVAGLLQEKMR